jgi:glycosyltransferase involved in cell wall biosynthesis
MRLPQVSVLLPVRNEAEHLPATLASLYRQSLTDWELVAVDDGSSDATATILSNAAAEDSRIKLFKRPAQGLVAALNFGLEQCRAKLVARLDGDDICHPRRLEQQYATMNQDPRLDLLGCRVRHFPRPQLQGGMLAYESWQNSLLEHRQIQRDLFVESPFAHPSVIYRKEAVTSLGGYREMEWAEDYDLWLRMAETGARFARLPQTLLYWRDRPQRLTRTASNCSLAAFRRCKIHFLRRGPLANSDSVWIWGAGSEGKLWRKSLAEVGIKVSGWIDVDSKKIGRDLHRAQVVSHLDIPAEHPLILACVGTRGVRKQIRDFCATAGMLEGTDYLCVA